jgi:hypothetical protein
MKLWQFIPLSCGLGAMFLSPCSSTNDPNGNSPPEIRSTSAQVVNWMRHPKQPSVVFHDGSLSSSSLLRETDLPAGIQIDSEKNFQIQKEPLVTVRGKHLKYEKDQNSGKAISRLVARQSCRFNVVDSGGFYSGIADFIQYRADHHDLILRGSPIIQTGNRTLSADPQVLMRVDLSTGRIFANGHVTSSDAPL